jgi:hypothetical protein
MNFYITIEPCRRLKNLFSNLSSFYIIDVDRILYESGLDINNKIHQYLINVELERLISSGVKSKRYKGIIYINSIVKCDSIISIKKSIESIPNSNVDSMVILDDYDVPKMQDYYTLFDEVVFFPTMKKSRIIECKPINVPKIKI